MDNPTKLHNFWMNRGSKHLKLKPELSKPHVRKICVTCFLIAIP